MYGDHTTISNALEQLRKGFASAVPARLEKLNHSIELILAATSYEESRQHLQSLIIAFNSLAGTSATYGYYDISKYSRAAELHLKNLPPSSDAVHEGIDKLRAFMQAISLELDNFNEAPVSKQQSKQLTSHLEINRSLKNILIYLADEDKTHVSELAALLTSSGFKIQHFTTLYELEERVRFQRPDILILNNHFDGNEFSGFEFISELNASLEDSIPTIFISEFNDPEHKYHAATVRGSFYLKKPPSITELLQAIEQVVNKSFAEPYKVLLVEEDPAYSQYIAHLLEQNGIRTRVVNDSREALYNIEEFWPEVILLDVYMSGYNGIELASMIRMDAKQQFTSILFLSTEIDANQQLEAITLGGDDFLAKPIDPGILIRTVEARAQRARAHNKAYYELRNTVNKLEQFRVALDQHAIVSVTNASGKIIYANPKFCSISGYSADELIGRNHNILNSGYHDRQFFNELWQTISSGNIWQGEIKNRSKQGKEYWVASTITPLLDNQGKPYQYISIRTDITSQKTAINDISLREERLRYSQEYAHIGTWDWNIQSGELFWSKQIGPLFGYDDLVETTYENFINAVHPDDRQYVMDSVNACVNNNAEYDIEHRIVLPTGKIRWVSEKGGVVRDTQGKALHMLGVVQDITLRKKAESELKDSQDRLEQAQTQALLGNWEADLRTGELSWSDIIYKIFGYDPNSFIPSIQAFRDSVHPHDLELVLNSEELAKQSGHYNLIHRIIRPNGEIRYVHEIAVLNFEDGEPTRFIGTVQDITELKKAEMELIEAKEEAEAANLAKSNFLSRMSHELRTPMNAILGFAQLMDTDTSDPLTEGQKANTEQILKAGWHLLELINEILDLSKIESGNLDLAHENVDASMIIRECITLVSTQAEINKVSIENHVEPGIKILADATRFKQVCLNLLTNAIKYNTRNGKIILESELRPEQNSVKINVTDTGIGMDNTQLSHLFEPFNRLGAEESIVEGTGIGLVIARSLVNLMGGEISVQSEPGVGSSFQITLNTANPSQQTDAESYLSEDDTQSSSLSSRTFSILYVEDNAANLRLVSEILGRMGGIDIHSETTGLHGLETAKTIRPDLILIDINLPDMNGADLANTLKAESATKDIPLVAISANAMQKDIAHALSNGFVDYLTKPINVKKFVGLVNRFKDPSNLNGELE